MQAGIALLAGGSVPYHFTRRQTQRLMRAAGNAFSAIVTTSYSPRIVTVLTAQITAL